MSKSFIPKDIPKSPVTGYVYLYKFAKAENYRPFLEVLYGDYPDLNATAFFKMKNAKVVGVYLSKTYRLITGFLPDDFENSAMQLQKFFGKKGYSPVKFNNMRLLASPNQYKLVSSLICN